MDHRINLSRRNGMKAEPGWHGDDTVPFRRARQGHQGGRSAELVLPDDMLVPITQAVDSLAPVYPALGGLCFQPAAKLTILLGDSRRKAEG
jgi:hypothetical protein